MNFETDYYEIEQDAFENYAEGMYSKRVPRPIKPNTSFLSLVGAEAFLYFVAGISAALFSSIRTGGLFYIVESLLLEKFAIDSSVKTIISFAAFLTALMTFELFMLADGFSKGKNADDIKPSLVGMITASLVIGLGGLFSSTGLIEDFIGGWEVWFNLIVAMVTAVASVIIVYVGGKNVGYTFLRAELKRKKIDKEFMEAEANWNESAIRSFKSSTQGKEFYKALKEGFVPRIASNMEKEEPDIRLKAIDKPNTKTGRIKELLNEYYETKGVVPSWTEIKDFIANKALARAMTEKRMGEVAKEEFLADFDAKNGGLISRTRKEWLDDNRDVLGNVE